MHHKLQKHLQPNRGFIVVKNGIILLVIWSLLLLIAVKIDWYSKTRELEHQGRIYYGDLKQPIAPISRVSIENEQINFISTRLVKLLDCPNIEAIEADNKEALSYMTEAMAKRSSSYLESRVDGIKKFMQQNKNAKAYLMQDIRSEIAKREDLPEFINKSLLKENGFHVLVEGTMKAFDDNDKEIHSKRIRRLVNLVKAKPTPEKPTSWLADSVIALD